MGWVGLEISGQGYAKSTFNANKKNSEIYDIGQKLNFTNWSLTYVTIYRTELTDREL